LVSFLNASAGAAEFDDLRDILKRIERLITAATGVLGEPFLPVLVIPPV
jgi:hypothetical protein